MNTPTVSIFFVLLLTNIFSVCSGQGPDTLSSRQAVDKGSIEDMSWLAGFWTGEGMGGYNEEFWSSAVDGTMMGIYRHIRNGKIVFYELLIIMEDDEDGLVIRLKHFHPDLTGWEEKDRYQEFKLLKAGPDEIEFDGLLFHRVTPDSMSITVTLQSREGTLKTETLGFRRSGIY